MLHNQRFEVNVCFHAGWYETPGFSFKSPSLLESYTYTHQVCYPAHPLSLSDMFYKSFLAVEKNKLYLPTYLS